MAKRSRHSYIKFEKERKRKKKAQEKMARRQSKKDQLEQPDAAEPAEVEAE